MGARPVRLLDPVGRLVAVVAAADAGAAFGGTVDLTMTPPAVRAVFDEFEEVVNGQMFSFLDEVEAKVAGLNLTAVFPDGASGLVTDLQVYPGSGRASFKVAVPAA